MAFYLQLIGCNLVPGLLYSHYMTSYMLGMPFAKVERLQTAYYLTQASMIMVLIVVSYSYQISNLMEKKKIETLHSRSTSSWEIESIATDTNADQMMLFENDIY